jgi:flagella basal body P-ring formation protein FlgA
VPIEAGATPDTSAFVPANCPSGAIAPAFRYDSARGYSRLSRDLAPGEIVSRYPGYATDAVRPGQGLRLIVVSGVVRVERSVEALQAARPGHFVFVKLADGQVLSVRYEGGAQ